MRWNHWQPWHHVLKMTAYSSVVPLFASGATSGRPVTHRTLYVLCVCVCFEGLGQSDQAARDVLLRSRRRPSSRLKNLCLGLLHACFPCVDRLCTLLASATNMWLLLSKLVVLKGAYAHCFDVAQQKLAKEILRITNIWWFDCEEFPKKTHWPPASILNCYWTACVVK